MNAAHATSTQRSKMMSDTIRQLGLDPNMPLSAEQEREVRQRARQKIDADPGYRGCVIIQKYETRIN